MVCCVRIEDHDLLADFYFAVLEAASTLVHVQDSIGSGLLCVDKPEGARDRAFAEQALASADNHRKLPYAQRIDEIALEQVRVVPGDLIERSRSDELRPGVEGYSDFVLFVSFFQAPTY